MWRVGRGKEGRIRINKSTGEVTVLMPSDLDVCVETLSASFGVLA